MRADAIGLFWKDEPAKAKVKKEVVKRTAPEPTWLRPDYLPNLEQAQNADYNLMSDDDLMACLLNQDELMVDVECYVNYFLVGFLSLNTGKRIYFEMGSGGSLDCGKIKWIMENFLTVGFNSNNYDLMMIQLALAGLDTETLKYESDQNIAYEIQPYKILKKYKIKKSYKYNHIDLIEVAPLSATLKIYGGRIHAPALQDLPFPHGTVLSKPQIDIVRYYNCFKDLVTTAYLRVKLKTELELRALLSQEYKVDLRSKSDAQIAEALVSEELKKLTGIYPKKPNIEPGTVHFYKAPAFLKFNTESMQWVLNLIQSIPFVVGYDGTVDTPHQLKGLKITLGGTTYKMGIGGLHSCEKAIAHFASELFRLFDIDAESFYPFIILNLNLFPKHLGEAVLRVYRTFVMRRLEAKHAGNKKVSDSLKITINGFFGKLGSVYSIFYSPELLIQVTLTGQLLLLMLAERFELAGIPVVSGNTDGIVAKCPTNMIDKKLEIIKQWEIDAGFKTEINEYSCLLSRDVNCYVAVKVPTKKEPKFTIKNKGGLFTRPGLQKNPTGEICIDAVEKLLIDRIPIEETIRNCTDIRRFIHVRKVKGGAVELHESGQTYLGEAIRWYYAKDRKSELVYAKNGNRVPKSVGACPIMDLPEAFPLDVDYDYYIRFTEKILKDSGYPLA